MLIWSQGQIIPEEELAIAASDRVFEHGLGLFETFRTWDGEPVLLPRHLDRLTRSAAALGLPLDPSVLPDSDAVGRLLRANRDEGDLLMRITMTGGLPDGSPALVWLRSAPLPASLWETGATLGPASWSLDPNDPLIRHKTLNYWSRRLAFERGRAAQVDEVLFGTPDGRIWEGSRMNLFLVHDQTLVTPDLSGPVLPGIMRGLVLELAPSLGLNMEERPVFSQDMDSADEVFLTSAVRGLVPVRNAASRTWTAPGSVTTALHDRTHQWLIENR